MATGWNMSCMKFYFAISVWLLVDEQVEQREVEKWEKIINKWEMENIIRERERERVKLIVTQRQSIKRVQANIQKSFALMC